MLAVNKASISFFFHSLSLCICLCICLSICLSFCITLYLFVSFNMNLSLSISFYVFLLFVPVCHSLSCLFPCLSLSSSFKSSFLLLYLSRVLLFSPSFPLSIFLIHSFSILVLAPMISLSLFFILNQDDYGFIVFISCSPETKQGLLPHTITLNDYHIG